ncbi:hypothetical protein MRX96_025896 [Rhipicephalus microplus]
MSEPPDRQKVIEKYLQGLRPWLPSTRGMLCGHRDLSKSSKSNVVFSMIHCGSRFSLDNVPFRVVKETVKVCIFGTEYYKKTQEKKKRTEFTYH